MNALSAFLKETEEVELTISVLKEVKKKPGKLFDVTERQTI